MTTPTAPGPGARASGWLGSIQMLGTTIVVLMIGGMVLWLKAESRDLRLAFTIASAVVIYAGGVAVLGRRSRGARIPIRPFAIAGLCAGAIAELVNAQFLLTRECAAAGLTGAVIGLAHWAALRSWLHLSPAEGATSAPGGAP